MGREDAGRVDVVWGLWLRGSGAEEEGWRGTVVEESTPLGLVALDAGTREEGRVAGRISPAWHSVMSRMAWREGEAYLMNTYCIVEATEPPKLSNGYSACNTVPLRTRQCPTFHLDQCLINSRSAADTNNEKEGETRDSSEE